MPRIAIVLSLPLVLMLPILGAQPADEAPLVADGWTPTLTPDGT